MASAPVAQPSSTTNDLLVVDGLSHRFGGLLAVDGVGLRVPRGGLLALIGPNGAGKSTTVNLLSGVLAPTTGTIVLDGIDLAGQPAHLVARRGLVRTFQNGRLFTRLSVLENVLVGAHADAGAASAAVERAMALLSGLGLAADARRPVGELSYGRQRKIEIARALMSGPRLLMLDEPAAGLNSGEVEELIAYVSRLRERGLSILLIEHNMGLVMRLADRIAVLDFGRLIADGDPASVRADPAVVEAYLGRRRKTHAAL